MTVHTYTVQTKGPNEPLTIESNFVVPGEHWIVFLNGAGKVDGAGAVVVAAIPTAIVAYVKKKDKTA